MDPKNQVAGKTMFDRWDADSNDGGLVPVRQCGRCLHKWPGSAKCFAFPQGIPEQFLNASKAHNVPRPDLGQRNQLVFEERKEGDPQPDMSS